MNATDGVHLTSIINKLLQLNKECSFLFHYFPKEGPIVRLNNDATRATINSDTKSGSRYLLHTNDILKNEHHPIFSKIMPYSL